MRWLLHGNLTPAVADALRRHEQQVVSLDEVELPHDAPVPDVLAAATRRQLEVLTASQELASAPFEQAVPFKRTLVFLQLEGGDVEQDDAVDRLFQRYRRLSPGRLYTVTGTRVKVRQLPGG